MGDLIETMLRDSFDVFRRDDRQQLAVTQRLETSVDKLHEAIKLFVTDVSREPLNQAEGRRSAEILVFTTNLEHIGDIIDKSLLELADKKIRLQLRFSREGWAEIEALHAHVLDNLRMALGVFVSGDVAIARKLIDEKVAVRDAERQAAENHLARLRAGRPESIDSSALHLDILRDLKRIHSHICAIAYPLLDEAGQLYRSRLKRVERRAMQEEEEGRPPTTAAAAEAPAVADAPPAPEAPRQPSEPAVASSRRGRSASGPEARPLISQGRARPGPVRRPRLPVAEGHEADFLDREHGCQAILDRGHGEAGRGLERVAVDAGADAGKGDRPDAVGDRELEGIPIAGSEQRRLALAAAVPDRAHGVDHVTGRQSVALGDPGLAGRAAADFSAFVQELGPGGTVDRAVDPAAAEQTLVGRIDDRINRLAGDVALDDDHASGHRWPPQVRSSMVSTTLPVLWRASSRSSALFAWLSGWISETWGRIRRSACQRSSSSKAACTRAGSCRR